MFVARIESNGNAPGIPAEKSNDAELKIDVHQSGGGKVHRDGKIDGVIRVSFFVRFTEI